MAAIMKSEPHILDLAMVRRRLRDSLDTMRDELAKAPAGSQRAARLEGAFMTLRGVLADEIEPMLEGWREGIPQSRAAERLVNGEAPDAP